jgi:hypothetical protein
VSQAFNVLALIKGTERYIFVYDDGSRDLLLEAFQANAADPELSFNWFDAAVLTEKARQQAQMEGPAAMGQDSRVGKSESVKSERRFLTPES